MATKQVDIPDLGIVHLYKRRDVRSIRLSLSHDGQIRVSLPYWVPYATGTAFVRSKAEWIKSRQTTSAALQQGGRVGKAHRLAFVPEQGRTVLATRITSSGEVRVFHPAELAHTEPAVQNAAKRASIRALKQQAEKLLPTRLKALAQQHGFQYNKVAVKQLKSRWGSCSSDKDIALNIYLMQLPWHLIDYVLLHELVHTRIMAHGSPFWAEMDKYIPNLRTVRKEMKTHSPVLVAE